MKSFSASLIAQNRSIAEPVKDNQAEINELRKKLENYQNDRVSMNKLKKRYDSLRKQLDNLKMELDAKILHCEKITEERDELKQKFEEAVLEVQQKSSMMIAAHYIHSELLIIHVLYMSLSIGLKSAMLERKLSFLEKETEQRESLLGEVLKVSNIEPTAISVRIEKLLSQKNEKIQDLRYELARVSKAHDDLLEIYKAKMIKFGIPIEEFGSLPFNQPRKCASSYSRVKH